MEPNASEVPGFGGLRVIKASANVATTSAGLAVVGIGAGMALVYELAMALGKWVPFFLAYKPIIDLTWRWEFIQIFNQRVNIQALLAMFVALLNGIVLIFVRKKVPHYKIVLLLLAVATVSVLFTPTSEGVNELLRLYAGVSFFFTAGLVLSEKKRFDRFVQCFLWALMIPVILALLQTAGLVPYDYWDWTDKGLLGRASGSYPHPLDLVLFLVFAIPLALYQVEESKKKKQNRVFLYLFLFCAMAALVSTILRMGWFAICLEIGLWLLFKKRYKLIFVGGIALLATLMVFSGWLEMIFEPSTEIAAAQAGLLSPQSFRGRGMDWFVFVNSYVSGGPLHWLIGRGGSFAEGEIPGLGYFSSNEAHDDFLRLLNAYGLVGLGLYLAILWRFYRDSRALQRSRDDFAQNVGNVLFVSLVAILFLSITAEPMRFPTGAWYLFSLGSIAAVLHRQMEQRASAATMYVPVRSS